MIKKLTCIECPKSCSLEIDIENCRVVKVEGNKCPRGEAYAVSEIENPRRILTGAVLAEGLEIRMIPVKTDKPILKSKVLQAASELKKIKVDRAFKTGDVIVSNFLGLGVNLISTRDVQGGRIF